MGNAKDDVADIRRFFDSFAHAYEKADFDSITGNVTEDLRLDSASEPTISGKSAFGNLVTTILANFSITKFQITIEDLVFVDGHAFVIAVYTWTLVHRESKAEEQRAGRFAMLLQWHDESQRWRVRREVSF